MTKEIIIIGAGCPGNIGEIAASLIHRGFHVVTPADHDGDSMIAGGGLDKRLSADMLHEQLKISSQLANIWTNVKSSYSARWRLTKYAMCRDMIHSGEPLGDLYRWALNNSRVRSPTTRACRMRSDYVTRRKTRSRT